VDGICPASLTFTFSSTSCQKSRGEDCKEFYCSRKSRYVSLRYKRTRESKDDKSFQRTHAGKEIQLSILFRSQIIYHPYYRFFFTPGSHLVLNDDIKYRIQLTILLSADGMATFFRRKRCIRLKLDRILT